MIQGTLHTYQSSNPIRYDAEDSCNLIIKNSGSLNYIGIEGNQIDNRLKVRPEFTPFGYRVNKSYCRKGVSLT